MPIPSPTDRSDLTLSLIVKINDEVINDSYSLIDVNIDYELNKIAAAELSFLSATDANGSLTADDDVAFEIGNLIEILAAYGQEQPTSIFAGVITKQSLSINDLGGPMVKLVCRHQSVAMTFNRKDAEFSSLSDSDLITQIIRSYPLNVQVDETTVVHETILQKATTDWDFIMIRAEFYGLLVNCVGSNTLQIAKPKLNAEPVLRLAMGESIIEFEAEWNGQNQAPGIEASAWNSDNQDLMTVTAEEPIVNAQGDISAQKLSSRLSQEKQHYFNGGATEEQSLQAGVNGSLLRMRLAALRGSVKFQGSGLIKPGDLLLLEGVGSRYNGNAFVSSVVHEIREGNWFTTVGLGLDNVPFAEKVGLNVTSVPGQLAGINGLQIATVKNLNNDPKSQFRIQVILNAAKVQQDGIWARVSHFYATSGAGSNFLPEIGDEVIVGFLDSDSSCPIVLGSLYSSSKAPAYSAADGNYIKAITTRSQLKVSFDDGKKILSLSTPEGNSFVLDDENKQIILKDENGNVVTMDSDGISLSSSKDIIFAAKGDIKMDANGSVNLMAGNEANINALSIKQTAKASFTANGEASAELRSSGQTMVNGAIVMIN